MQNMKEQDILDEELRTACNENCAPEVQRLLELGADPTAFSNDYFVDSSLHITARTGNIEILSLLLMSEKVEHVDIRRLMGMTPLMVACSYGNVECANLFVNAGANVIMKTASGMNALHYSAEGSSPRMVCECLSWSGVDVNEMNGNGMNALMIACQCNRQEVVNILLNAGAHVTNVRLMNC